MGNYDEWVTQNCPPQNYPLLGVSEFHLSDSGNSVTMHECDGPGNLWGEPHKPQPALLVPRECRALWGFHRLSRSPTIAGQKILYNYHSGCVVDFCFVFCWGTNIFFFYWLVKGVVKNDKKLFKLFCFAISSRNIAFHDCNCFCKPDVHHIGGQWSMIIDIMLSDKIKVVLMMMILHKMTIVITFPNWI